MNDVRQQLAGNLAIALGDGARQLNHIRRIDEGFVRATEALFQPLGVSLGNAQAVHDVTRDVVAAEGNRAEMPDFPLVKEREIRRARTHLDERDTQLLLVLSKNGECARQRLEHELSHTIPSPFHGLSQIQRW